MNCFDGKQHKQHLAEILRDAFAATDEPAVLHIIQVGDDPVTSRFVRAKVRFGQDIGAEVVVHHYEETVRTEALVAQIQSLGEQGREGAAGVIVQLPLPEHVDVGRVLDEIPVGMDVDLLSTAAWHGFLDEEISMEPPVGRAIMYALASRQVPDTEGLVAVVGQGRLVGQPTRILLERQGFCVECIDADTPDGVVSDILARADIVVTGVGVPGLVQPGMVKQGVALVDAGTSESAGALVGDVDSACYEKAAWYTPVPGGVGPLTVAMIFVNLYNSVYGNLQLSPRRDTQ